MIYKAKNVCSVKKQYTNQYLNSVIYFKTELHLSPEINEISYPVHDISLHQVYALFNEMYSKQRNTALFQWCYSDDLCPFL